MNRTGRTERRLKERMNEREHRVLERNLRNKRREWDNKRGGRHRVWNS
jgi:hypothetical protein